MLEMNYEVSLTWATITIAAFAVLAFVVSILVLCAQTKQLKLQNYIEYTKRYQEIVLHFPENINEQNFDLENFKSDYTREKTMRYMRAYYDLCFEEYDLKSKGFLNKKMWRTWEGGMVVAFKKPAFKQAWEKIRQDTGYSKEFKKFVDDYNS